MRCDEAKRSRIAQFLTDPANARLPEREIARRTGSSKGAVNIVKRLLRGLPTRKHREAEPGDACERVVRRAKDLLAAMDAMPPGSFHAFPRADLERLVAAFSPRPATVEATDGGSVIAVDAAANDWDRNETLSAQGSYIWFLTNRYFRDHESRQDCHSEAVVWFLSNFHLFDGNPLHLPVFTRWAVQHAAQRVRRRGSKWAANSSLELFGDDFSFEDSKPSADREAVVRETVGKVAAAVESLPEKLRMIVVRSFGLDGAEPETLQKLAREHGCTRANLSLHRQNAFSALAEVLA
jgi:DNA-directed RNA polymerase specialized sigma24 family protein